MTMHRSTSLLSRILLALAVVCSVAACSTPPPPPPEPALPEPVQVVDPAVLKEQELSDAIQIYFDGRYDEASEALAPLAMAPELPLPSQVKALKYIAFSQCATGRRKPCRQAFDTALELDPTFQLTEAEKGHPVWGREFNNARAAARSKSAAASRKKP